MARPIDAQVIICKSVGFMGGELSPGSGSRSVPEVLCARTGRSWAGAGHGHEQGSGGLQYAVSVVDLPEASGKAPRRGRVARMTATVTATAAANGYQQQLATTHNARTIRGNLGVCPA
jgi:hypothetical protein